MELTDEEAAKANTLTTIAFKSLCSILSLGTPFSLSFFSSLLVWLKALWL